MADEHHENQSRTPPVVACLMSVQAWRVQLSPESGRVHWRVVAAYLVLH